MVFMHCKKTLIHIYFILLIPSQSLANIYIPTYEQHLRMDIIKQQQKAEREEEERIKLEQEKTYRLEQERLAKLSNNTEDNDEEEVVIQTEYLVYICQCCNKMYKTTNAFQQHTESKKHQERAKLFEEAGVIVTEVVLADELHLDVDEYDYEDEDEDIVGEDVNEETKERYDSQEDGGQVYNEEDDEEEEEEEEEETEKVGSLFSALAAFSDDSSSSSSSSSSSDDESLDGEDEKKDDDCTTSSKHHEADTTTATTAEGNEWEDDLDLLEDIIYQNRLNERLYPDDDGNGNEEKAVALPPVDFDDEQYDADDNFNGDRLAAVQHRLQKRYDVLLLLIDIFITHSFIIQNAH